MLRSLLAETIGATQGHLGDILEILFGLGPGMALDSPAELRREAARVVGLSVDQFRRVQELRAIEQLAELILQNAHSHRMRLARLRADLRTPIGTRLAVEWLKRFEAYYRIWSPASGLGSDLSARQATRLESHWPDDEAETPDGHPSSQQRAVDDYGRWALTHFAGLLVEERRFETELGGLWLLPTAQAENNVADAMQAIRLESPLDEQDQSCLRQAMSASGGEMNSFLKTVALDPTLRSIHDEWQAWADCCDCSWTVGERVGREMFPISGNHTGISSACDLHNLIRECNNYCLTIDDGWDEISDWYRDVPFPARTNVTSEQRFAQRISPWAMHDKQRTGQDS